MTFHGLAGGPEQLLNGAQVRAVTLCCSRHLIVTFLGPGGGHEWLQKGVRVSAVTLHCSRLLSVTFLGLVGRPELLLKRAQIRAVTLCYCLTLYCQLWANSQECVLSMTMLLNCSYQTSYTELISDP